MRALQYLVFHHSASPRSTTTEQIREWHLNKGWRDIGYNGVIEEDGTFHLGRRLGDSLAANPPYNRESIAICITGNNTVDEHRWNRRQIKVAGEIADGFRAMGYEVTGHRDVGSTPTECPGVNITEII